MDADHPLTTTSLLCSKDNSSPLVDHPTNVTRQCAICRVNVTWSQPKDPHSALAKMANLSIGVVYTASKSATERSRIIAGEVVD